MDTEKKEEVKADTAPTETEKPKKKKGCLILILALIVIIGLFGCVGGSDDDKSSDTPDTTVEEEATATDEEQEDASADVEEKEAVDEDDNSVLKKELKDTYTLKGGKAVRNDVTNSWVIEAINSGNANDPTVWAYDYVQAYWEEGINVMWVVNFANNTTTSINTSDGSMIFVTQREYVEDEEHDAKVLGNGTTLGDWVIYKGDDGNLVIEET